MLTFFRVISLLEGISYLAILSVTIGFIGREYVSILGMGHGVLFMLYLFLSAYVSHKRGWPIGVWLLVFFASLIPFAFLGVEVFLRKEQHKRGLSDPDQLTKSTSNR